MNCEKLLQVDKFQNIESTATHVISLLINFLCNSAETLTSFLYVSHFTACACNETVIKLNVSQRSLQRI